jgi:hypothetical protein
MADQAIAPAQTIRELLEQLNLHMNEPEPVILCRTCQFALSGSIKSIVDLVYDDVADRPLIRPPSYAQMDSSRFVRATNHNRLCARAEVNPEHHSALQRALVATSTRTALFSKLSPAIISPDGSFRVLSALPGTDLSRLPVLHPPVSQCTYHAPSRQA